MTLLARTVVLYHGDFDWPGIVIARRIFDRGARPWQFGCRDYIDAVDRLPADVGCFPRSAQPLVPLRGLGTPA